MPDLPVVFHQEVLHIDPENPRQGEQIVHRGQRFSPLPFVDCLRVLKTKVILQVPYGQPPLPAQCGNPLAGALHIDGGKCCFLIHSFSAPFLFDIPFPSMVSGRFYHTIPSHVGSGGYFLALLPGKPSVLVLLPKLSTLFLYIFSITLRCQNGMFCVIILLVKIFPDTGGECALSAQDTNL